MRLNPVELAIQRFGGLRPMARALGIPKSTIQRWGGPPPLRRKGVKRRVTPRRAGTIPSRWHPQILAAALTVGVPMTPLELLYGAEEE